MIQTSSSSARFSTGPTRSGWSVVRAPTCARAWTPRSVLPESQNPAVYGSAKIFVRMQARISSPSTVRSPD
ncbi:MAG: hypothetical protein ABFC89_03155 [Methanospirillum sp.]